MTNHPLAQNWRPVTLLRFAAPTIFMMLFMGLYTIVDILFVARFVGTDALSVINIVGPVTNLIVGLGTMLATGGNAILSVSAGITNIILDYVFIVICDLGIRGAALGTGMGMLLPALGGWMIFSHKKGILHFTKPVLHLHVLTESCLNGASELVSQCATAVTALSNGRLSATLSFLRTFGLLAPFILILPNIANTTGL